MKILLISESEIRKQSIIEQNTDSKTLGRIISNVQEVQLKPILGSDLYNSVMDGVYQLATNATPLPSNILLLLETYIVPFLVFATMTDFIVLNNYKISGKGVLKLIDHQGTAISSAEIEYAKSYYANYADTYKNNLIEYLGDNKLIALGTYANVTAPAIGWYLERSNACVPDSVLLLDGSPLYLESLPDLESVPGYFLDGLTL